MSDDSYHRVAGIEAPITNTTAEDIDQEVTHIYDCLNDLRRRMDALTGGLRGERGFIGPSGEDGVSGDDGAPGPIGARGADGASGAAGVGVPGDQGEDGEDGLILPLSANLVPTSAAVLAYRATAQNIPVTTETAISFSNVDYDTDTFWASGAPTRLTVPSGKGGKYIIVAQVKWALVGTGPFFLRLYKNGATLVAENVFSVAELTSAIQVSAEANLAVGDYIEFKIYHNSSATPEPTVGGVAQTFLSMAFAAGVSSGSGSSFTAGTGIDITAGVISTVPRVGLVLLEEHAASSSSSLDFATRNAVGQSGNTFQSDYDEYLIEFVGLVPANNNVGIGLRVTTDGGATYVSTGSYAWTHWVYGPAGTGQTANTAQTEIRTIGFINASNTSTFSMNGSVRVFNALSTALHKVFGGLIHFWDTGPSLVVDMFSGAYSATTAITGVRVLATAGNLASGTARIYGVKTT
jgi:hypothetical protein